MKNEFLLEIIKKIMINIERNMDYLVQLSQGISNNNEENITISIKRGISIIKDLDEKNLGKVIESLGEKLVKKDIHFAKAYGRALVVIGTALNNNLEVSYNDLSLATKCIINDLQCQKEKTFQDALVFWEGFKKSIDKGEKNNLNLSNSIKKAIKENHWPMYRNEIDIDEHIIFFCTRISMTTYLRNSEL